MEIRPITFRQASDFINAHHRHHGATVGHKFSVGPMRMKNLLDALCAEDQ